MKKASKLISMYNTAKSKNVGESCICPSCNSIFIKTNYQQVFCKSKTGTKCKDYYWNNVTPEKRNNTTRISPASARYMSNPNRITGYTSEGYKIINGTAYDEFDEPVYDIDIDAF